MDLGRNFDELVKYTNGLMKRSLVNRICILMEKAVPRSQPEINRTVARVKEGWTETNNNNNNNKVLTNNQDCDYMEVKSIMY
jgi:hypothetical protein